MLVVAVTLLLLLLLLLCAMGTLSCLAPHCCLHACGPLVFVIHLSPAPQNQASPASPAGLLAVPSLQVFVTAQARTLDLVTVYAQGSGLLVVVSPGSTEALMARLDKYIFPGDKVSTGDGVY